MVVPLVFLVLATGVLAQSFPSRIDNYVNDFAGLLDQSQTTELRSLLSDVEQQTTAEIVVVIVNATYPETPSAYRTILFNEWGVGKADKDNGLLILYAVQEHRIEVEVGYGLEGILPDSKVGRILDEQYVPKRDAGNVTEGIVAATTALAQVVMDNAEEVRSGQTSAPVSIDMFFVLFPFLIMFGFIYVAYLQSHPKCTCGGRSDIVSVRRVTETVPGPFGTKMQDVYTIITYKCRKCGRTFTKKKKGAYQRSGGFIVAGGGGFGGGGFGGGGFGGGGSGGGGAGR
jgi:uncharacterized protein